MTFVNTSLSEIPDLARSEGRVEVGFKLSRGKSSLKHLYQSGCGRVRFPSVDHFEIPEAVLINTAGGLTGGDKMHFDITVSEEAKLTVTGQAAEKIYKSIGPEVEIEANLNVERGAYLEWLPQETILFEKARLRRMNSVHLAPDSIFLGVESTILGRRAHGETLTDASLTDGWKIWRDGKLVWFDQFRLNGKLDELAAKPALLDGATAFATVILSVNKSDKYLQLVRDEAEACSSKAGATRFDDGLVIIRLLDANAYSLRQSLVRILVCLRNELAGTEVPMPTVWEV